MLNSTTECVFLVLNNLKILDLSYKTDLEF